MDSSAEAYVPAAISNFFTIDDGDLRALSPDTDLHNVGAMGGGYMLSKGVRTVADVRSAPGRPARIESVVVDGDPDYEANTTRTAAEMLLRHSGVSECHVKLTQTVEVPVGQGFGSSAASALSAVNALAAALELKLSKAHVAYFAHAADILCRTGLGTVSVIYRYGGAGIIVKPGSPGVARVKRVKVPANTRIVTASLAPFKKGPLLSAPGMKKKVNRLGLEALKMADDLSLESLVRAGEIFAEGLGLESPEIKRLIETAKSEGAIGASQNMVGHAVHALVLEDEAAQVAKALRSDRSAPLVNVYGFGKGPSVD
jgi:pantoate kinase